VKHLLFALNLTLVACGTENDDESKETTTVTETAVVDRNGKYSLTSSEMLTVCSIDSTGLVSKTPAETNTVELQVKGNEATVVGVTLKHGDLHVALDGVRGLVDEAAKFRLEQTGTKLAGSDGVLTATLKMEGAFYEKDKWAGRFSYTFHYSAKNILCESVGAFSGAKLP
jgi:hypothetical protein